MSKKGENIYKRRDGRWEGRYIRGYLADGKAKYAYVYGKTYTETKQKLFDSRVAQVQGIEQKTTQQSYKIILNDSTLDRLTTQAVERHISFLLSKGRMDGKGGLAPKTVSDILAIIKGSIDYARCSGCSVNCYLDRLTVKKPQTEMRVSQGKHFMLLRPENGVCRGTHICLLSYFLMSLMKPRKCSESLMSIPRS